MKALTMFADLALIGNVLSISALALLLARSGWWAWQNIFHRKEQGKWLDDQTLYIGLFVFYIGVFLTTTEQWARLLFALLAITTVILVVINRILAKKGTH